MFFCVKLTEQEVHMQLVGLKLPAMATLGMPPQPPDYAEADADVQIVEDMKGV